MRKIHYFLLLIMFTSFNVSAQSDQQPNEATNPLSNILIWKNQNDTTTRELYTSLGYSGGILRFERIPRYHDLQFKFLSKMDSVANSGYVTHSYFNVHALSKHDTVSLLATRYWVSHNNNNYYSNLTFNTPSGGGTNVTTISGSGIALNVDGAGGVIVNNRSNNGDIAQMVPHSFQISTNSAQTQYATDIIRRYTPADSHDFIITFPATTSSIHTNINFPDASGTVALIGGASGALPVNDTSILARKIGSADLVQNSYKGKYVQLQYGATITTPPAGYGNITLNNNGSLAINKANGNTHTWASTYSDNTIVYSPYKSSSILADSIDIAAKYAFSSVKDTYQNIRIVAWGDSQTRGTGAANGLTYLYDLGINSGYIIYNAGVNGETSTQIATRMLADTTKHSWKTLIWTGRNDITLTGPSSVSTIKANDAAMVTSLGHSNYIVMGVLYKQNEIAGSTNHIAIDGLNTDLATLYPGHFLDPNPILIAAYNPTLPQDVIDYANGVFPTSLSSGDGTHLNNAGQQILANYVYSNFNMLSANRKLITPDNLPGVFNAPPAIGTIAPNTGSFTFLNATDTVTNQTVAGTSLVNFSRSGTQIYGGQYFNYTASFSNSSTLVGGGGSSYNVAALFNASNGVAIQGNIAGWFQTGNVIIGSATSGFANKLDVQGISRFGVAGAINGDMTVANKITVNQGTSGTAIILSSSTGASGTAYLQIGNTATSGVTWGFRLGGNTANGQAGAGVSEGNLGLYDQTNNKLSIHVQKLTTNIGIHGVFNATAQLQFATSTAAAKSAPIKFGLNSVVMTAPEPLVLEATNSSLFFTDTLATVKTRREVLLDTKTQSITNKTFDMLRLATGANGSKGTTTLTAGTVTVSNTSVTASSIIIPVRQTAGGTVGTLSYTVTAGTGFTITSSSSTDTSTLAYLVIN